MNFNNDKALQLTIEYMRNNHMKALKHNDYFKLFLESYRKFLEYVTSTSQDDYIRKVINRFNETR